MMRTIRRSVLAVFVALLFPALAAAQQQEFEQPPIEPGDISTTMLVGFYAAGFVISAVIAAVFIHLLTQYARSAGVYLREDSIETGLIGLGVIIGTFVLTFVLTLTGIGVLVSVPLLFAFGIVALFGYVLLEITLGREILERVRDGGDDPASKKALWKGFLVGYAVLTVLGLIPILNLLVVLVAWSLGVGLLVQLARKGTEPTGNAGGSASGVSESW